MLSDSARVGRRLGFAAVAAVFLGAIPLGAATITVTGIGDTVAVDGVVTLREAITSINNGANVNADVVAGGLYGTNDTIVFNIPGAGLKTIAPASALPTLSVPITINGYSQPGSSANTNAAGAGLGLNGTLLIEINGTNAGPTCLNLNAGNSTIQGLVINRCATNDLLISSGANNTIQGNYLGTNAPGTAGFPGKDFWGINLVGSSNDVIGGLAPSARNLINAAGFRGIEVGDSPNTGLMIQGNLIGTNAAGTAALVPGATGFAISLRSVTGSVIGGGLPNARNVISGIGSGILLGNSIGAASCTNNQVQGNFIGTDVTGTQVIGNGGQGIAVYNVNNTIGGSSAVGNVVAGSGSYGIYISGGTGTVVKGNFIGTDVTGALDLGNKSSGIDVESNDCVIGGPAATEGNVIAFNGGLGNAAGVQVAFAQRVTIRGNSIYGNKTPAGLGIDLVEGGGTFGVTANDPCDADTGANGLQNYPVLTTAFSVPGSTTIQGTLNSVANTTYTIDYYSSDVCDPSGFGEGKTYIGSSTVTTDATCNLPAPFLVTFPTFISSRQRLTATATDPSGNTSEFSSCISLRAEFNTIQPCRVADTRNPVGPYGGPALSPAADRSFVITGQCGIPATAQAVAFNFAIVQPTDNGHIRVYPGGNPLPLSATMNYSMGQIRANNAVVPLGPNGDILIHLGQAAGTSSHLVIDVNGYFE